MQSNHCFTSPPRLYWLSALLLMFCCGVQPTRARAQGYPNIAWMRGGHADAVTGMGISSDGTILVTADSYGELTGRGTVKVHQLKDGTMLSSFQPGGSIIDGMALAPGKPVAGNYVVAVVGRDSWNGTTYLRVFSIPIGKSLGTQPTLLWQQTVVAPLGGPVLETSSILSFSADGAILYYCYPGYSYVTNAGIAAFRTTDGKPMGGFGSFFTLNDQNSVTLSIGGDNVAVAWMLQNGQPNMAYFSNSAIEAGQGFIQTRSIYIDNAGIFAVSPDGNHIAYVDDSSSHEWFLGLYSGIDGSLLLDMSDLGPRGGAPRRPAQ